jgi:acetyl esterase/lipase
MELPLYEVPFSPYLEGMAMRLSFLKWGSLFLAAFLALAGSSRAQDVPLDTLTISRDVEYAKVGARSLKLDIYVPKAVAKPMPVVIWIHGGGWRMGTKDAPMVLPLTQLGFAVVSIDYRLSQEAIFPAQIYDCKAAVRWVRAHATQYGFDPNRIGAAGASAGGHLVALLGTTSSPDVLEGDEGNPGVSSAVQAVCDFFGPTDFTDLGPAFSAGTDNLVAELLGGAIDKNRALARQASPVFHVNAQSAPFYIGQGDADTVVPVAQSIELDAVLKKAGVPSTLYIVKGGGHMFYDAAAFQVAVDFLRHYLHVTSPVPGH